MAARNPAPRPGGVRATRPPRPPGPPGPAGAPAGAGAPPGGPAPPPPPPPRGAPLDPARAAGPGTVAAERLVDELVDLFARAYWDPDHLDWGAWGERHRAAAVAAEDRRALDAALGRMVRELGDDHSSWLGRPGEASAPPPSEAPRLGLQLAYVAGQGLVIERVYAGTPAETAGLRRADVITAVGALDVRDVGSLFEANAALAAALAEGPAQLTIRRGRVAFEVEVPGAAVAFRDAAGRPYALLLGDGVGYLHVPTFQEPGVGAAVHAAVRDLAARGATALVLDLRGNLGGRLVEAGLAVGPFLEGDWARAIARGEVAWRATYTVVSRRDGGEVGVARLEGAGGELLGEARGVGPVRFSGPRVVGGGGGGPGRGGGGGGGPPGPPPPRPAEMGPGGGAAAGRARVVGERTAGNVEAVRAYRLSDGSQVLVAIARLEAAGGARLDDGVAPEVTARATVLDLARGQDPPLAEALRLLAGLPFVPGRWF